jgi:hypothetical protein
MAHLLNTAAGLASGHPQVWFEPLPVIPESLPLSATTLVLVVTPRSCMCVRVGALSRYLPRTWLLRG